MPLRARSTKINVIWNLARWFSSPVGQRNRSRGKYRIHYIFQLRLCLCLFQYLRIGSARIVETVKLLDLRIGGQEAGEVDGQHWRGVFRHPAIIVSEIQLSHFPIQPYVPQRVACVLLCRSRLYPAAGQHTQLRAGRIFLPGCSPLMTARPPRALQPKPVNLPCPPL